MAEITRRATFYSRAGRPQTFHIETTGAIINITVGLSDADGRLVERVDVLPMDRSRGGDAEGRIWVQDGPRIIRQEEDERAGAEQVDHAAEGSP